MKSKKHKKHKDHHKSGCEDVPFEQRPLKLVLKVGSSSSPNNLATAKKKKKSRKHKHGHHRSHHSHHHHRHHRRSSCSHHSKSSSSSRHHPLKLPDKEMNDFSEIELIGDEELTAEQILAHVKKAAKIAADRFMLERPDGSHLSFLRQKNDGITTLDIIGSQGKEKKVTLGSLVGQLSDGISCLPPYKEPEANRVKMIDSVTITPFSSFLPSMDSTFATVTYVSKEETQLLTSTYGEDEIALHYTQSLLSFANDNDFVMNMIVSLLEVLTHGQHGKTMHKLKDFQKEKKREKEKEKEKEKEREKF